MNKIKLGDCLTVKHGWAFKGEFFSERGKQSILTPGNFYERGGFKPNNGKERYYIGEYPSEYLCCKGDLIVAMTQQAAGLLGSTAIVPEDGKYLHNQRIGLISCSEDKMDKLFAYYLFMTKSVREQLERSSSGTKVKHTSPEKIYEVEVTIPEVELQKKIAHTLSEIDAKISVNDTINDNLQQQLKLIYDYWFTQFDFPNEDGKPYRSSGGKMVWNDVLKRDVPAIFQCVFIKDVVQRIATGLNPRDNFTLGNGKIRYVTVKNLTIDGSIDFSGCDRVDEKARQMIHNRSGIQIGDILFASIAPLGRCHLIQEEPTLWDINESVFTIRSNDMTTSEYLYSFLSGDAFVKRATSNSTGSIFKGIRINTLLDTPIIVPPKKIADAFSEKAKKLLRARHVNAMETESLIELRDWLLPMLMNGQVTITD